MNLLIIESPLQLLCAYEAIKINPHISYKLLIRRNGRGANDLHMKNCINSMDLEYTEFLLRPDHMKIDTIRSIPLLFKLLKCNYETLYLGSFYSSFLNALKKIIRYENLYYLDDGASTIKAQLEYENEDKKPVNFFTFFKLTSLKNQKLKYHNFEMLREHYLFNEPRGSYFIGQPVEKMLEINEQKYYSCVKKIASRYTQENPLIYIPHRIENLEPLQYIENIKVTKLDMPLELHFLQKTSSPPLEIYGFYSTALLTVKSIFPDTNSYYIKINGIENSTINAIYEHYQKSEIKVINL